jgi:hypothetical protein
VTDVLQLIDDAIADYSVSDDAMRWNPTLAARQNGKATLAQFVQHQLQVELMPWQREILSTTHEQQRAALLALCRDLGLSASQAFGAIVEAINAVARQLQAAELMPPPAPIDPMQRALEARRNRNTGPAVPLRAPRRIDPQRAR